MQANDVPEKVNMDKSGANKAAIDEINDSGATPIIVRQVKYLNNIVEQDHRAAKRVTKPMLNFKSFQSAKCVLAGIELMHMIRCHPSGPYSSRRGFRRSHLGATRLGVQGLDVHQ